VEGETGRARHRSGRDRSVRYGPPNCGYYLRGEHRLIRRHEEALTLNADNTARWDLRIDLELPDHPEAGHSEEDGTRTYLFPLVFLRKNESRMQFRVYEEERGGVPLPIRSECDSLSSAAVSQAMNFLAARIDPTLQFEEVELAEQVHKIPSAKAFEASMALQFLREELGILPPQGRKEPSALVRRLGKQVERTGLDETLELLVEHALVWVPLQGRKNERRSIFLTQQITLHRRSILRWYFGKLDSENPTRALKIAGEPYGRRKRGYSASAVGERIGQPLGWMPFEFELPTIYAKRCSSYHFEVRCPPGRTPRDLKVSSGPILNESASQEPDPVPIKGARRSLSSRNARFDVPRGGLGEVSRFRVIIGIGDGAFPLLWFLSGAITAIMLWILAGSNPDLNGAEAQTLAGILLIVPALVAGLAAGSSEIPISQLIGSARILLLSTGLSAIVAASVLAGFRPFEMSTAAIWSVCAMAATATTVPLATSWLLSSPFVWWQMKKLSSYESQVLALAVGSIGSASALGALALMPEDSWLRIPVVGFLLLLMIGLSALASNRAALPMGANRRYIGVAFLLTGLVCLALACVELRCLLLERDLAGRTACFGPADDPTGLRLAVETGAALFLALAYSIGDLISRIGDLLAPREHEIPVSPRSGRALLSRESVREIPELFERERDAGLREQLPVRKTA
jgi:hypothetical protein